MDHIKKSSKNKTLKNINNDSSDFKDLDHIDLNNNSEMIDESLTSNVKKNTSVLLKDINHIVDVKMNVSVQLGQTKIKIKDLLNISTGSVLTLDKSLGEPLDIFVNESLIAQGEIVVVEDKYGIRIISIIDSSGT